MEFLGHVTRNPQFKKKVALFSYSNSISHNIKTEFIVLH